MPAIAAPAPADDDVYVSAHRIHIECGIALRQVPILALQGRVRTKIELARSPRYHLADAKRVAAAERSNRFGAGRPRASAR